MTRLDEAMERYRGALEYEAYDDACITEAVSVTCAVMEITPILRELCDEIDKERMLYEAMERQASLYLKEIEKEKKCRELTEGQNHDLRVDVMLLQRERDAARDAAGAAEKEWQAKLLRKYLK